MKELLELIAKLKALEAGLKDTIIEVLRENESIIVEMNSQNQLFEQGITRDGVSIADYAPYSPITIEIKKEKGQPTNRVTLRDEGDFEQSFYLEITETGFEIKASDWKTADLVVYYGEEILGLTDDNLQDLLKSYILPELLIKVNSL